MIAECFIVGSDLFQQQTNFLAISRPHRSTINIDAAYCYRPSSDLVCRSVGLSVCQCSPAKTAQPIEMSFGLRIRVGPRNHVLDGGLDLP